MSRPITRVCALSALALLSACGMLDSEKINYRSATKAPSLEVPPDLTQMTQAPRYALPGAPVTASGFSASAGQQQAATGAGTAAVTLGDVQIVRNGRQQWLYVRRDPDQLWSPVKDFWAESGFVLTMDQRAMGLMETDWAENRAKIPNDFIRATIGKALDSLYSTSERDRFRTRLERTDAGTEIFISHRGMIEVYTSSQKESTVWQPRPNDPELEAEFLRRLMARLAGATPGTSPSAAAVAGATVTAAPMARAVTLAGAPAIELNDGFDRAWRRVGLSLDRTGFTVEDRDRARGVYFVRYVEPDPNKSEPGFFARMFGGGKPATPPLKLQIQVNRASDNASVIKVLSSAGAPETSPAAQRIVNLLVDDLK